MSYVMQNQTGCSIVVFHDVKAFPRLQSAAGRTQTFLGLGYPVQAQPATDLRQRPEFCKVDEDNVSIPMIRTGFQNVNIRCSVARKNIYLSGSNSGQLDAAGGKQTAWKAHIYCK